MRLIDHIAQCRLPFAVQSLTTHLTTHLSGAADYVQEALRCPMRFVLSDDLTRLCTALAYSKGARTLACADLLHIPAERVWVEWCEAPWRAELSLYGFAQPSAGAPKAGRRGALIKASRDGRRGLLRTFWNTGESELDVLASSMEAYFDLDTPDDETPESPDGRDQGVFTVADHQGGDADILRRCFRFRYEESWAQYYASASLALEKRAAVAHHALGTVAIDVPVLLAFFLLLGTRSGLPQRRVALDRLNRSRAKASRPPLLEHVEVMSPLLPAYHSANGPAAYGPRRTPRLHHVRGHIVRRGSQIFWRVPHIRGNCRSGVIRSRTVTWTIDKPWSNSMDAPRELSS